MLPLLNSTWAMPAGFHGERPAATSASKVHGTGLGFQPQPFLLPNSRRGLHRMSSPPAGSVALCPISLRSFSTGLETFQQQRLARPTTEPCGRVSPLPAGHCRNGPAEGPRRSLASGLSGTAAGFAGWPETGAWRCNGLRGWRSGKNAMPSAGVACRLQSCRTTQIDRAVKSPAEGAPAIAGRPRRKTGCCR